MCVGWCVMWVCWEVGVWEGLLCIGSMSGFEMYVVGLMVVVWLYEG